MQRKVLSALVVSLFMVLAVVPMFATTADTDATAEIPRPYPEDSDDFLTFEGIVKYEGDYLTTDKLAGTHVIIFAAYHDESDNRDYFTEMPGYGMVIAKESLVKGEDGRMINFSVKIPRITDYSFKYYICVENGYKISGVSGDKIDGTPTTIYPYPYASRNPGTESPWHNFNIPSLYTAYAITEPWKFSGEKPIDLTGVKEDSHDVITLMPAKVNVSGSVMSGKFALANVNIDFCRLTSPDTAEYSAITNKNGEYVIKDVNTGTYIVKVYTNGYTAEDQIFDVTDGGINILDISMDQNNTVYFGYDMPHFLLILGGIIGIILIVASLFFQYWVVKKKHDNWVYNDMKDKDKED